MELTLVRDICGTECTLGRLFVDGEFGCYTAYDIFVGIMWRRFGTETKVAGSGTEEEFPIAYRSWEEQRKLLELVFYFCQAVAPPRARRRKSSSSGASSCSERSSRRSGSSPSTVTMRPSPTRCGCISCLADAEHAGIIGRRRAAEAASPTDLDVARHEVAGPALQYEQLRRDMPSRGARTRPMEVVAPRMRTLALSTLPILPELAHSDSPGKRLAALTTLQAIPDPMYLGWLAGRLTEEKPFIGFHAALALLNAARTVEVARLGEIGDAIASVRRKFWKPDTDRDTTLRLAEEEIARRLGHTDSATARR